MGKRNFGIKSCQSCGRDFTPTGSNQRYCSDCGREEGLKLGRRRSKLHHADGPGSGGNQVGDRNTQWKGGVASYQRKKLASVDNLECERCGSDLSGYVKQPGGRGFWAVHHKDHDRNNNRLRNLELLCKRCHQLEHECWRSYNGAKG